MVESREHDHLKDVALIWLLNQGCFMVGKEVGLSRIGLARYTDLDTKTVIDALGIGMRYSPSLGRSGRIEGFEESSLKGMEAGECVLRGVEVKVSRGDFRAGFACSGCNYHYLLTPLRLLAPCEVPSGVGLIEYNRHKFMCDYDETRSERPYKIEGLRVLKRAEYQEIPRFQVDGAIASLAVKDLYDERLKYFRKTQGLSKDGYVRSPIA